MLNLTRRTLVTSFALLLGLSTSAMAREYRGEAPLPVDADDTDVACGVWNSEVYILGVQEKRTGRKQTLLGDRVDVATGQVDDPEQSAV